MEYLRDPVWQAIGVLAALVLPLLGWLTFRYRTRQTENREERERVRALLVYMQSSRWVHDKRFNDVTNPYFGYFVHSLGEMRSRLRTELHELPEGSKAIQPVLEMHKACLEVIEYVDSRQSGPETPAPPQDYMPPPQNYVVLEQLRRTLKASADKLRAEYRISKLSIRIGEDV